jgi:hypothetical protein
MPITISGNGVITGIAANGLPSGVITAAQLASTIDLSSKTVTLPTGVVTANQLASTIDLSSKTVVLPGNTRTTTTETKDNTKEIIDNPTTGGMFEQRRILRVANSGEEILQQKLVYAYRQSITDYWIKILIPNGYSNGESGGTAIFKLSYHTPHAAGGCLKTWKAAFGSNHGREFIWAVSSVETLKVSDSFYGWTPTLTHWRNSSSGDSQMREYYIKTSGYPTGYNYVDIVLEIDGTTGSNTWPYALTDLAGSAPSGISQLSVTG